MIERSQHQNLAKPVDINGRTSLATRPTNLPTEHRRFHRNGQALVSEYPVTRLLTYRPITNLKIS